jgi:cytochrome c
MSTTAPIRSWRQAGVLLLVMMALGCWPAWAALAPPDPVHGEEVYVRCQACHALAQDRVGPRHCGVVGRRAGSVPGYAYSSAMKASRLVWNAATLDRFLRGPLKAVPGSTMTYDGVPDAQDRADLIAWLAQAAQGPPCR